MKNPEFPRGSSINIGSVLLSPGIPESTETAETTETTERNRPLFLLKFSVRSFISVISGKKGAKREPKIDI